MNLLLDTHVLLWSLEQDARLGPKTLRFLGLRDSSVWVSAASIWEISIKSSLGRLKLTPTTEEQMLTLLNERCRKLLVTFDHAFAVQHLPHHHGDPFDRMLVAQARVEDLTLVTADPAIMAYDVRTLDASI